MTSPTSYLDQHPERSTFRLAFISPTSFASESAGKILPRKQSCLLSKHGRRPKKVYPTFSMNAGSGKPESLPDFDRDYFDDLKAELGHLPGVRIFSRNDYTLDPQDTPWLFDDRARDLDQIREDLKSAPISEGELEPLPSRPMRMSDMHTEQEIEQFESRFRECDAVGGKVWEDPMPESDFDGDPRWIHLRKVDDEDIKAVQEEPELCFEGMDKPALRRKQYASEEEEIAALMDSFQRLQAERNEEFFEPVAYGESNPVPDPDEFRSWQREAETRGGNATEFESYALSPFSCWKRSEAPRDNEHESDENTPRQHQALVSAHLGEWDGQISVISVCDGERFAPHLLGTYSASSEVTQASDGSLEWTTTAESEGDEIVSFVTFSSPDCKEALIPGRAVAEDGCYVCKAGCTSHPPVSACTLSLSSAAVRSITRDGKCDPLLELGLVTKSGGGVSRHRVVFCVNPVKVEGSSQKNRGRVTKLIVVTEVHRSVTESSETRISVRTALPTALTSELLGTWNGDAVLLQPEYPPNSCLQLKTKRSVVFQKNITDADVTFVENTIPEHPEKVSKRRVRTVGKKKISKRVAASKAHDRNRLSPCRVLSIQKTGTNSEERYAWQTMPREKEFSFLYSPRIGRFVDDYCGILVAESLLCTFPFTRATPSMWNEISLGELASPMRKRITVGRNETGDVVGVLFVSEHVEDNAASDSVASYV